jgi:predicted Rossmann-fold nucleotide-binding protein
LERNPLKVIVCGGRDFGKIPSSHDPDYHQKVKEYNFIQRTLDRILHPQENITDDMDTWLPNDVTVITGGATGVDGAAVDWGIVNWTGLEEYYADWKRHGRAAGPIRNKQMLDEGKPDLVVAFPGGKGTANMVKQAREAGVKVIEIEKE